MNQELKRIREKDFTKIDETLFQNVSRADNMSSTLTHLSEFQKFLMEQISVLNHPSSRTPKDNKITQSLVKNFDNLKQSLLKCSKIQQKASKTKVLQLKKQFNHLKDIHQKTTKHIVDQKNKLFCKNKEEFQKVIKQIIKKYEVQKKKNDEIELRCQRLQSQLKNIGQENVCLHGKIEQQAKMIELERINMIKNMQQRESLLQIRQHELVRQIKQSQPLRQIKQNLPLREIKQNKQNLGQKQVLMLNDCVQQNGWKIMRDKISQGHLSEYTSSQKNQISYAYNVTPIKRCNSNHKLPCKTQVVLKQKESSPSMVTKKDLIQNLKRGKSKQKIKLFSMF